VGVAPDHPQRTIYVVRVISETPNEETLRGMFMARGIDSLEMGQQYARERLEQFQLWMENLEKEMQVVWHRSPQGFDR
jgi:hypothetical protein